MHYQNTSPIFDYKALRLMVGIIALTLPVLVTLVAGQEIASVSASYHTDARNYFVGLLFVVGALMLAYNGHSSLEALASKVGATSAIVVALIPTDEFCGESTRASTIHLAAAVLLFLILAWFCFGPFRKNTKGQPGKKGRRAKFYFVCGSVMIVSMAVGVIGKFVWSCEELVTLNLTYWVEAIALGAFGVAWIVAGKIIPMLVDDDEALKLFRR